ncbi:MAG: exo-alpha-sialidase [Clostridia bacterium]|nr:exo-alpha-sialidase [Clostridia bacterium]MBQ8512909.1 exo-alpha-sialidase [Clostridia bacterium]
MKNARVKACDLLYRPTDARYDEGIRQFQGCPTIAVTPGGRIYLGWYSGGTTEPHMENYNLLVTSDDGGKTWSSPLLVIPSSKENQVHALDIQLWCDPKGRLHVFWVQNNTEPAPEVIPKGKPGQPMCAVDGWLFSDFTHSMWETVCENPDDDDPVFSEPKCHDIGFLRCKPTVLENGDWLYFNYDQEHGEYGYSISRDEGKTVERHYGVKKLATYFDEGMAYQRRDGSVRMFARTGLGELAETVSRDNGLTWEDAHPSGITAADTRFYVARTPSGRVLLVINDDAKVRRNMTICLSDDDGAAWKYKKCIDTRNDISYPDCDFCGGKIYLTYDRERRGAKEILFTCFTEEDVMNPDCTIEVSVVSKP